MAIANFTGGEKRPQTFLQMRCSVGLSTEIHQQLIYLSAFNIFLSIIAVLGNTLILVALRKETSLHPPSKLLFRCLATTDLCVGVVVQPIDVAYWMSLVHEDFNLHLCPYALGSAYITGYALCLVSLLTVTAISVDRLLALLLGLRYRQVVTLKRTYVMVVIFWVVSSIASTMILVNQLITIWYGNIVIPLCIVTSVVSYCKIFFTLRHHQTQAHVQQEQLSQINPLNITRYKKAVSSVLWIQCTLVACYLPYSIFSAIYSNNNLTPYESLILDLTSTLVFFNSSLNPFLYCWKISEVKQAVKQTIREALCCLST